MEKLDYNDIQLKLLRKAYNEGLNVISLLDPRLSSELICCYIEAIRMGIDIDDIINPDLNVGQLILLIDAKMQGIDVLGLDNWLLSTKDLSKLIYLKQKRPRINLECIKKMNHSQLEVLMEAVNYYLEHNISLNWNSFLAKLVSQKKM